MAEPVGGVRAVANGVEAPSPLRVPGQDQADPHSTPSALLADNAYSARAHRALLRGRGITTVIPPDVAAAQKQLKVLQWVTPVLTTVVVVHDAQQGEHQRPAQVLSGLAKTLRRRATR